MRKLLLATLVLAGGGLAPAPAQAASGADGLTCGMSTTRDPATSSPFMQIGTIDAGPVVGDDVGASVVVECDVQDNPMHNDPRFLRVAAQGTQAAVQPPIMATYVESPDVWVCTRWHVTGSAGTVSYYYDGVSHTFSTSPNVECVKATVQGSGPTLSYTVQKELASA